jgi:hypothetical protein
MMKKVLYVLYFCFLAGLGIVVGCYIHAGRVNQTTLMSGVAFVRELPMGEHIVGYIETTVFSYQEEKDLTDYKKQHPDTKIDPKILEEHEKLYRKGSSQQGQR